MGVVEREYVPRRHPFRQSCRLRRPSCAHLPYHDLPHKPFLRIVLSILRYIECYLCVEHMLGIVDRIANARHGAELTRRLVIPSVY